VYVCVYVCLCVYVCVCACAFECVNEYVYMYVCKHACIKRQTYGELSRTYDNIHGNMADGKNRQTKQANQTGNLMGNILTCYNMADRKNRQPKEAN